MAVEGQKGNYETQQRRRRRAISAESFDPYDSSCNNSNMVAFHPKTQEQLKCLREAAKNILFFHNCDNEQQEVLYNAMFERTVDKGEIVIREGDDGDNFYIIEKGEYHILRGPQQKCVTILKDKGYFGELALLYNCPRNATIQAYTSGILWGLDQKMFRRIVVTARAQKRCVFEELLKSVSLLDCLTPSELMNLTDALADAAFSTNDCIISEGDSADKMYFIMSGEVSVRVRDKDSDNETEIVRLKRGKYFGELALVLNRPRAASVYSVSDATKCAVLDIYAFERLLGPCVDIMKRNIENYEVERKLLGVTGIPSDISNGLPKEFDALCFH